MQGKINTGRHTDHPAGRHSIQINQCPPPPTPNFLQAGCPSYRPTNSVKARIHQSELYVLQQKLLLHPFNGLFSRTTWVSQHQKCRPFCVLLEQEMMRWQWHQLDHMHMIRTSLQTDNHASTSTLSFYRPDAFPAAQPTASKHQR